MRSCVIATMAISVSACGGKPHAHLQIESVQLVSLGESTQLISTQQWQFSDAMLDALAHGVPLNFSVRVMRDKQIDISHHQLRYAALANVWEWQFVDDSNAGANIRVRRFANREQLEAALERLEWPLAVTISGSAKCQLQIQFEPARLPAPLRLPALFDTHWRGLKANREFACV